MNKEKTRKERHELKELHTHQHNTAARRLMKSENLMKQIHVYVIYIHGIFEHSSVNVSFACSSIIGRCSADLCDWILRSEQILGVSLDSSRQTLSCFRAESLNNN